MEVFRYSATSPARSGGGSAGSRRSAAERTATLSSAPATVGRHHLTGPVPGSGSLTPLALLLFPVLAALGRYATVDLSPRMFPNLYVLLCAVAVIPALVALGRSEPWRGSMPVSFVILVVAWVVWAPLTLAWTPVVGFGINRISLVSAAIASGLCVLGLAGGAPDNLRALRLGWTAAFVVTGAIALWEMGTGQHLDANHSAIASGTHIVTSSFYNPNNYAAFLLACLPFLAWNGIAASSIWSRYLHVALIVCWVVLIVATRSRTGIIGAGAAAPLLGYWVIRSTKLRGRPLLLPALFVGLPAAVALSLLAATATGEQVLADLSAQFATSDGISYSDQARLSLTMLGWQMFVDSGTLGQGAGAFASVANYWGGLELYGLTNAHNGIIEIAAEYGLPVLLPLLAVICALAYSAFAGRYPAHSRADVLDFRMATLLGLVAVVASNLAASSILLSPWWWLLLGQLSAQAWLLPRRWVEGVGRRRVRRATRSGRQRPGGGGWTAGPREPFASVRAGGR